MSWTDERIGILKKMWKEGKSAAEIAKTLGKGVTRNAVIGKAHRMGLSGRPSPIKKQAAPKKGKAATPAPKKAAKAPRGGKKEKAAPAPTRNSRNAAPPAREVEEPVSSGSEIAPLNGGITLLDLTERMCKWPIGDPREPDFVFCGRGIRIGTPYCPDHAAMAYQSSSRRGQAAIAAANDKKKKAAEAAEDEVEVEIDDDDIDDVDDDDIDDDAEVTTA